MNNHPSTPVRSLILIGIVGISFGGLGLVLANKARYKSIENFSTKAFSSFGVTQEIDSISRVSPLNGIYRPEAIPKKILSPKKNNQKRPDMEIGNIFMNFAETYQAVAGGL